MRRSRIQASIIEHQAQACPVVLAAGAQPGFDPKSHMLSTQDVAKMLAVSERHIYRQLAKGAFPRPYDIGGVKRFLLSDILGYIEQNRC